MNEVDTYFAPAARASKAETIEMNRFVEENPLFQAISDSIDGLLMVLNPQRQILAVNEKLREILNSPSADQFVGFRPGELLACVHAPEGPGGCGTAKACASCGAVNSILLSQQKNEPVEGECLATVRRGEGTESLEFRVRATPVAVGGHQFTVLVFNDISGDKRREALERTFFHDVLNTVGGLMGWSSLLEKLDNMDPKETARRILILSRRLKQEIEDQRRITEAEHGTLETQMQDTPVASILATLTSIFEAHEAAKGKRLEIAELSADEHITTDISLLTRVLTNMVKNALEAVAEGETVRVWYAREAGNPAFFVRNPSVIPESVAQRIFQRSFSTKASSGRGIGTYSMKLFGERYLGGKIGFESTSQRGTIFWIKLPA